MKKLLTLVPFLFVLACSVQESAVKTQEKSVTLISPSGIEIAPDADVLKEKVKGNARSAFGEKGFRISKVTFTETKSQIASFVEFESDDKEYGSVLLINTIKKSTVNGREYAAMETRGGVVVDCAGGCDSAGDSCRERVILSGADNKVQYECTCSGSCKMTINQQ